MCITTLYRVGTLGDGNFQEVEQHLRCISLSKRMHKHIFVGDFNLNNVLWPDGLTTNNLQMKFVNLFNELGFTQFIEKSTHEEGRALDLLLCNVPQIISDIKILEQHTVCKSDHFGITFDILFNVKRLKSPKRRMFNFKKADWTNLNIDLKNIRWKDHLCFCDSHSAWIRFKSILLGLCDVHISKVTIQSQFQPPWFDSEMHKLCREKERLRQKASRSKDLDDIKKFKKSRKTFKIKMQEKLRINVMDDSDPALITKKFWSHVKSASNTTRIPETVHYKSKFRSTPKDQADLFNTYFSDQFSAPSNYNIGIDFQRDCNIDITFS